MLTSNNRTDPKKFLDNAEKPLDKSVNPCYNTNTKKPKGNESYEKKNLWSE